MDPSTLYSTAPAYGSVIPNVPAPVEGSKIPWKYIIFTVAISIVVGLIAYIVIKFRKTTPLNEGFSNDSTGNIVNSIDSVVPGEFAEVCREYEGAAVQTEEGRADLRELSLILGKLSAVKSDLQNPANTVNKTAKLPYSTMHDREPVGELVARCLSKTIPQRELDITFETLRNRGQSLIYRLAKQAGKDTAVAAQQFASIWNTVYETAKQQCIAGAPASKVLGPREAAPYDIGINNLSHL